MKKKWKRESLETVYAFCSIRSHSFLVKESGTKKVKSVYLIQGVGMSGRHETLDIRLRKDDSTEYWCEVLSSLKQRGAKRIILFYADGIPNLKEAAERVYSGKIQRILTRKAYDEVEIKEKYE